MKRDSKPIGGIGPGQGLSVRQALIARQMRKARNGPRSLLQRLFNRKNG